MKKKENGITLISLVITVVIMLILAVVALNLVLGNNGLFKKSSKAVYDSKVAEIKEEIKTEVAGKDVDTLGDTIDEDIQQAIVKVTKNDGVQIGDDTVTVDGKYVVGISEFWRNRRYAVAKIGETRYATLKDAVNAVPADGTKTTIEILVDFTVDQASWVGETKNVVIDCAGHTVSSATSDILQNGGLLEVKNGTLVSNGGNAIANCVSTAIVNIDSNLKVQGNSSTISAIRNEGTVNVNGAQIISNNNAIMNTKSTSILNCSNKCLVKSLSNGHAAINAADGVVNLNDCTIQNDHQTAVTASSSATINLNTNGKLISNSTKDENQSTVYNEGTFNLNGGSITNIGTCFTNMGTLITNTASNITTNADGDEATIYNAGNIIANKGIIKNSKKGAAIVNDTTGILNISGDVTFEADYSGCVIYTNGTATCQGGTIKNTTSEEHSSLFNVGENGVLNINNGLSTQINTPASMIYTLGTVNVKNATLENQNHIGCVIICQKVASVNITDGSVINSNSDNENIYVSGGIVKISNATVKNNSIGSAFNIGKDTDEYNTTGSLEFGTGALLENSSKVNATLYIEGGSATMNGGTIRNLLSSSYPDDAAAVNNNRDAGGTFIQNGGTLVGAKWGC